MEKSLFTYITTFVLAVLLQVLLFSNITFMGYCSPFLYVIVLLCLPVGLSRNWQMLIAFLLGLCIDMTINTPGMHTFCCVLIAFVRNTWIDMLFTNDFGMDSPSIRTFGFIEYAKYAGGMVLLHHTVLFMLESMSVQPFWLTLCRITINCILTLILVFCYELIRK